MHSAIDGLSFYLEKLPDYSQPLPIALGTHHKHHEYLAVLCREDNRWRGSYSQFLSDSYAMQAPDHHSLKER